MSNAGGASPLTRFDFTTETWRKLEAIWRERLEALRDLNDQPQTELETARLRGRIEELKFNLAQPEYLARGAAREDGVELGDVSALY